MYELREYNENDKEQITKLWVNVCVEEHGFEDWIEGMGILDEEEFEKIFVAVLKNRVIGTIAYKKVDNITAELKRVYIYPEHRGKGIAKNLYNMILDEIKEKGYKKIIIETFEKFQSGINFYYKNNFKLKFKENDRYIFSLDIE